MPLPPPPAAALIMTGKPIRAASTAASASSAMGPSLPGTTGTPAACMRLRALVFTPMASWLSGRGPMKVRPAVRQARLKSARSERNPYPGWMASAPVRVAASRIRSDTR